MLSKDSSWHIQTYILVLIKQLLLIQKSLQKKTAFTRAFSNKQFLFQIIYDLKMVQIYQSMHIKECDYLPCSRESTLFPRYYRDHRFSACRRLYFALFREKKSVQSFAFLDTHTPKLSLCRNICIHMQIFPSYFFSLVIFVVVSSQPRGRSRGKLALPCTVLNGCTERSSSSPKKRPALL